FFFFFFCDFFFFFFFFFFFGPPLAAFKTLTRFGEHCPGSKWQVK
ncbi:hypothetical protein K801_16301, partial [Salmonella enterica subsp. enterica serovar Newport str. SHSN011]